MGPITQALQEDDNVKVRMEAAKTLGNLNDSRAIEPLIQALKDDESDVREWAVLSLVKMENISIDPLIKALADDDEDINVRKAAIRVLGIREMLRPGGP